MSTELHKAFISLGLEPGASKEEVRSAYKLLVAGLHPDKHRGKSKEQAEKKLKQINNAKELIFDHFKNNHSDSSSCSCNVSAKENPRYKPEDKEPAKASRAEKARQRDREREQEATNDVAGDSGAVDNQGESPETSSDQSHDEFTRSYEIQQAKVKAAKLWKVAIGCLVFFLLCFAYAHMMKDAYKTDGIKGERLSKEEGQVYRDWDRYQQEKVDLVYKITGEKVTRKSAGHWQPPYETKYEKLLSSVRAHRDNRKQYDTSPHYADSTNPNPGSFDRKTGSIVDELNRNIVRYQGEMDKWKAKVDFYDESLKLGATGGKIQENRDKAYSEYISSKNRRDNARRQLNNLTKNPATINDLGSPYYYSREKNPWGSGTKPPNEKAPSSNNSNWSNIYNPDSSLFNKQKGKENKQSSLFQEK